jgi:heterodisulfide reductase subunit A-like polyferredoxin
LAATTKSYRGWARQAKAIKHMSRSLANSIRETSILIVGGGFGGLFAAQAAGGAVTLVDKRNFHTFQPLLYQAASGMRRRAGSLR